VGLRSQKPIELILLRQLAAHLSLPVFLIDTQGTLIFRNVAAEALFGIRPGELPDELPVQAIAEEFKPTDLEGAPIPPDQVPILWALQHQLPRRAGMQFRDRAGTLHRITTAAFPLEGQGGALLGAMAIFWDTEAADAPPNSPKPTSAPPVAGAEPIQLLLLRQVASYLAMPMFVVDAAGDLDYYNEPAEELLGRRYEETGQMPLAVWGLIFTPTDSRGQPLPPEELPLALAVRQRRATQGSFWIRGLDGVTRRLVITAIPLSGPDGEALGAMAIFWEG
jgi:FOG: PAS/PAC domain